MGKVKAILICVSTYDETIADNLPFCKNDLHLMNDSLKNGLGVTASDIVLLGNDGIVSEKELVSGFNKLNEVINKDDVLFVYFSGHAQKSNNSHYLCFSDSILETAKYIEYISSIKCKNKIIIIDACYCQIDDLCENTFQSLDSIHKNINKGTIIVTSSALEQKSYFVQTAKVSTFTYFLSSALTNNLIVKDGKKSLFNILYTTSMYMDFYNNNTEGDLQSPQIFSNVLGDIQFSIENNQAYNNRVYRKNYRNYVIHSIEPRHNFESKRYCIKIVLKNPTSYNEIIQFSNQIAKKLKKLNVFENDVQKNKWRNKKSDVLFMYFYLTTDDVINCHHICQTTWFDDTKKLSEYVKCHNIHKQEGNICFQINENYELFKKLQNINVPANEEYKKYIDLALPEVINIGEIITSHFTKLINKKISIEQYVEVLLSLKNKVNNYYLENSNIKAPEDLNEIDIIYTDLISILFDIVHLSDLTNNDIVTLSEIYISKYKSILSQINSINKNLKNFI